MAQYLELSDMEDGGPDVAWINIGHAMRLGLGVRIPVLFILQY
jgi:hypothetical protein